MPIKTPENFESLINDWLSEYTSKWSPATGARNAEITRKYLIPMFGPRQVEDISSKELTIYYHSLYGTLAASSIRRLHAVLSSFFASMEQKNVIDINPCRKAVLPQNQSAENQTAEIDSLTADDLRDFLNYADEKYYDRGNRLQQESPQIRAFIWVAAYSGCARGEIAALTWNDIDTEKNSLMINKTAYKIANQEEGIKPLSTALQAHTVCLPDLIIERILNLKPPRAAESDFIFLKDDKRILMNTFTSAFKRILKRYNNTHDHKFPSSLTLNSLTKAPAVLKREHLWDFVSFDE